MEASENTDSVLKARQKLVHILSVASCAVEKLWDIWIKHNPTLNPKSKIGPICSVNSEHLKNKTHTFQIEREMVRVLLHLFKNNFILLLL